MREAVLDFKKSGKPVYAYLEAPTTRDYYVASAASEIMMNPYGEMEMPGLAIIKTYYKNALDKWGLGVQVTRVGKYKSAVEPFILNKMSDADREETQKLIDDLWGDFKTAVSQSRPIDAASLQQLVDAEGYILPAMRASRTSSTRPATSAICSTSSARSPPPANTPAFRFPLSRSPWPTTSAPATHRVCSASATATASWPSSISRARLLTAGAKSTTSAATASPRNCASCARTTT